MINLNNYKMLTDWKPSTGGKTAIAERAGKKYFLKQYSTPVFPSHKKVEDGILTEKSFQKKREIYEKFADYRNTINMKLNSISGPGGNIISPIEWGTVDSLFVESTEFFDGLIMLENIRSFSLDAKLMIMMTIIGAMNSVHRLGVVHGDIKPDNIVVVKNSLGNHVGKLIDFDCSFIKDNILGDVGGTPSYMAPEVGECWMSEMSEKAKSRVTEKSDIFSLGVVFYEYITGEKPPMGMMPAEMGHRDPDKVDYWEYLTYGGIPQNLTKIKDPDLGNLLKSMMHLNASMRPSAKDVLDKLKEIRKEKASKPSEPTGTSAPPKPFKPFKPTASTKSGFCEPWPEHKIVFDKTKLTSMGFVSSAQVLVFGKQAYEFFRENGISRKYSVEQLLSRGLAKNAADSAGSESTVSGSDLTDDFCDPWPEHNIEFIPSEITRMHYISSRKAEIFGKKVYEFFRSNGVSRKYTAEQAVASGLAKIK